MTPSFKVTVLVPALIAVLGVGTAGSEPPPTIPRHALERAVTERAPDRIVVLDDDNGDGVISARELQAWIDSHAGSGNTTILLPGDFTYLLEQTLFVPRGVSLVGESRDNPPLLEPTNPTLELGLWAKKVKEILSGFNPAGADVEAWSDGMVVEETPAALEALVQRIHRDLQDSPELERLEQTGRHIWVPRGQGLPYQLLETRLDIFNYAMICHSTTGTEERCTQKDISRLGATRVTLAHTNILKHPGFELVSLGAGSPIVQISDNLGERSLEPATEEVYGDFDLLFGAPVTELSNVKIRCAPPPYYPIRGRPLTTAGGWEENAGFWAMGVAVQAAKSVRLSEVDVDGCAIGIYAYDTAYLVAENNSVRTGLPEEGMAESGAGIGDFAVRPSLRYQGLNGMRLHGPSDHDMLVRWNEIGEERGDRRRPSRGIHLHGSVLAGRTDPSGATVAPPTLPSLRDRVNWVNHFDGAARELKIARRNIWIYRNIIHGALETGVDVRADQANVVIAANTIRNVRASARLVSKPAAIRLQNEVHPSATFRTGFMFYPRNVLIADNTISDAYTGIQVVGTYEGGWARQAFQRLEVSSAISSCTGRPAGCVSAVDVIGNRISRTQSSALFIAESAGVRVAGNEFEDIYPVPSRAGNPPNNRNVIHQANSVDVEYGPNTLATTDDRRRQDQAALTLWTSYTSLIIRAEGGGSLFLRSGLGDWLASQELFATKGGQTVLLATRLDSPPRQLTEAPASRMFFQPFW